MWRGLGRLALAVDPSVPGHVSGDAAGRVARQEGRGGHIVATTAMANGQERGEAQLDPDGRAVRLLMPLAIAAVATGAFVLSFAALRQVAAAANVSPRLAWIWPVLIDAGVIVNVAAALVLRARGQCATYPWISMGVGVALSVIGNAIHATGTADGAIHLPAIVAMICAAVPPLVLMQATHLGALVLVQRRSPTAQSVATSGAVDTTAAPPAEHLGLASSSLNGSDGQRLAATGLPALPIRSSQRAESVEASRALPASRPASEPAQLAARGESPRRLPVAGTPDPVKDLADELRSRHRRGEKITGDTVAKLLGVSARTGSRRLKEITERWPDLLAANAAPAGSQRFKTVRI